MKLYSGPISTFGLKVEIAALEKGIDLHVEMVPFSIGEGYEPKHPEVLRINPKGQIPVLVDGSVEIYDSTQIFEYFEHRFPDRPMWPADPEHRAATRLFELHVDEVFFPNVVQLFPKNRQAAGASDVEGAEKAITNHYAAWDRKLGERGPWLFGDFGYPDVAVIAAQFLAEAVGVPLSTSFRYLSAWRERVLARPSARLLQQAVGFLSAIGLELRAFSGVRGSAA